MMFFGSLSRAQPLYNEQSSLRALLQVVIDRLCQRYKLALSLAVCLCLAVPAHASHADTELAAKTPPAAVITSDNGANNNATSSTSISTTVHKNSQRTDSVTNIDGLAPASLWQPELNEPSLYALLDAEFAADRDDKQRAITIYTIF